MKLYKYLISGEGVMVEGDLYTGFCVVVAANSREEAQATLVEYAEVNEFMCKWVSKVKPEVIDVEALSESKVIVWAQT